MSGTLDFITEPVAGENVMEAWVQARVAAREQARDCPELDGDISGTVLAKETFKAVSLPFGSTPDEIAGLYLDCNGNPFMHPDGPAGCVHDGNGAYVFFGVTEG